MTDTQEAPQRPRVTVDAEAWRAIDAVLLELPFRVSAPIVQKINETGGARSE